MSKNGTFVARLDLSDVREALALHVGGTAEWRMEKAKEYSEDGRNAIAVALLGKIEASIPDVAESSLRDFEDAWNRDGVKASELLSETLRCVGFGSGIDNAQELIQSFLCLV